LRKLLPASRQSVELYFTALRNPLGVLPDRTAASSSKNAVSFFIRVRNETLSIAVSANNPNCAPFGIDGRDPAQAPAGRAEPVGDYGSL